MKFILISVISLASVPVQATELGCQNLNSIFQAFGQRHFLHPTMDGPLAEKTAVQFVKQLDPSKMTLLEAEAAQIKAAAASLFEDIRRGDCTALDKAYATLVARAEDDYKFAQRYLGDGYKLDESVEMVVDPDKRGYAKTADERTKRLKESMHFNISNYLTAGLALPQAKKNLVHRYELIVKRLNERQKKGAVVSMFAEAFAQALDPHSDYMPADELANFQIQLSLSLEGIGAVLSSQDGFTTIESLVPGGQADKTGKLRPKDKIIAVQQKGEEPVPTIDMGLDEVVKMIRGPKGSTVTLTLLRDSEKARTFTQAIVRDKIDVSSQAAKIDYKTKKIGDKTTTVGVIDLPSFYGGEQNGRWSYKDVKALIDQAKSKKVDALVLDLTRNGGGLLEEAVRISGLFIKRGAVVGAQDSGGRFQVLEDEDDSVAWAGPLVVLTSPISASASEILAGALQDYHRAIIVGGTRSFGKGTVQSVIPLARELGAIKVTEGMFFLPGGESTQQRGVPADIPLPTLYESAELSEAKLDNALPPRSVKAFLSSTANGDRESHFQPVSATEVQQLAEKSKARVTADPAFAKVKAKIEELRGKGVVKLAELRKKKDSGGKEEDQIKTLEAVVVDEAVNIVVDALSYIRVSVQ